jgi:hypothetical protein
MEVQRDSRAEALEARDRLLDAMEGLSTEDGQACWRAALRQNRRAKEADSVGALSGFVAMQ